MHDAAACDTASLADLRVRIVDPQPQLGPPVPLCDGSVVISGVIAGYESTIGPLDGEGMKPVGGFLTRVDHDGRVEWLQRSGLFHVESVAAIAAPTVGDSSPQAIFVARFEESGELAVVRLAVDGSVVWSRPLGRPVGANSNSVTRLALDSCGHHALSWSLEADEVRLADGSTVELGHATLLFRFDWEGNLLDWTRLSDSRVEVLERKAGGGFFAVGTRLTDLDESLDVVRERPLTADATAAATSVAQFDDGRLILAGVSPRPAVFGPGEPQETSIDGASRCGPLPPLPCDTTWQFAALYEADWTLAWARSLTDEPIDRVRFGTAVDGALELLSGGPQLSRVRIHEAASVTTEQLATGCFISPLGRAGDVVIGFASGHHPSVGGGCASADVTLPGGVALPLATSFYDGLVFGVAQSTTR